MDHILSELSTLTSPSWVALQGMAHSFIELDKAVVHGVHVIILIVSFFFYVCVIVVFILSAL